KSGSTTSSASSAHGELATPVTTTRVTPSGSARRAAATSVVVPDRVIAITASYGRQGRGSEAYAASVSPSPAVSRSSANDSATKADVPQPITSTRWPGRASVAVTEGARSSARRQIWGWLAISAEVMFTGLLREMAGAGS